ncbi:MAG TPA: alpha/beta hydrolase fold domain-containing protein, partial [Phototrophicaceae bacterium]|nr:alpha/beta hydrolase fold domain-containing protein [Phototrophicaceae bacterium]
MSSLQSRLVIFMLTHRHWLRLQPRKRKIVGWDIPVSEFRQQIEKGAKMFGNLPDDIAVLPVQVNDLYAEWIVPAGAPEDKVILYFHGGGYVSGTCFSHRTHVAKFVRGAGVKALLFEYRLAPEHPFPAAHDDALAAYTWLLSQGILSSNIVFMGDSAGGGLALATLIALRDQNQPLPSAVVALSPWTDLK